jgi:uncharacterized protein YjiK
MISHLFKLINNFLNRYFKIIIISFFSVVVISVSFCNSSSFKKEREEKQKLRSLKADSSLNSASDNNKSHTLMPSHSKDLFPYDLDNPDERYILPNYLDEISGLAYYKENKILCVQDEKANIYILNLDKREIVNKYDFGNSGDYEDVAIVGQIVYVIRSDGRIFKIENFDKEDRKVMEYNTPLSEKNNAEGLTYDKFSNSLLIACKGSPALEKESKYKGYKAIYRFNLGKMKLDKEPNILVDLNRSDSYKDEDIFRESFLLIARKLQSEEGEISFQPSGIAIHPVYDEIYLICSVGKILIIMDRNGKILHLQDLNTRNFRQPEGICFSPSGDLFISNEGKGGNGYILRFNLQNR